MSQYSKNIFIILGYGLFGLVACKAPSERNDFSQNSDLNNSLNSSPFYIMGSVQETINTNQILANGTNRTKTISLNNVVVLPSFMNDKVEELLLTANSNIEIDYNTEGVIPFSQSPGAVDLGMGNVPVLDQGQYGTCVTFATTAAINAILGQGDLISQQCTLELTDVLGKNYWNGAYNALEILNPLRKYGLVEKSQCNQAYPNNTAKITKDAYKNITSKNASVAMVTGNYITPLNLKVLKAALNQNHRVAIGFGIKRDYTGMAVSGFNLNINGNNTMGGLWACEQTGSTSNYCGTPNAGHEVVVIGYDDAQELIKIRNSWGNSVGDMGDYYMTYRFFQAMIFDGTEIY